ncbi:MAG TPA: copper transporter [Solirubrobacteraceae bacterium]|nr:copper transporter [Solirubrobacteraceae bacterium]
MFDFRYHALSLAAVLLALAVGVVIGVAIGDSNLVSSAKSGIVHDLSSEVSGAQQQAEQLRSQLSSEETFANDLYPIAVHGLLGGRNVGLVFLGAPSNGVNGYVRDAITQAGGDLATVIAVREPLDLAGIARLAEGTRFAALAPTPAEVEAAEAEAGEGGASTGTGTTGTSGGEGAPRSAASGELLEDFASIVGKQLVSGGAQVDRELISRVRPRLLSAFDGQLGRLDGLVVMRGDPTTLTPEQAKASSQFETGLLDGVGKVGIPVVGVELSGTEPSQIAWYQGKDLASVDDLDMTAGQAALVYALTGSHGAYGTKSTADSLLPNVVGTSTSSP